MGSTPLTPVLVLPPPCSGVNLCFPGCEMGLIACQETWLLRKQVPPVFLGMGRFCPVDKEPGYAGAIKGSRLCREAQWGGAARAWTQQWPCWLLGVPGCPDNLGLFLVHLLGCCGSAPARSATCPQCYLPAVPPAWPRWKAESQELLCNGCCSLWMVTWPLASWGAAHGFYEREPAPPAWKVLMPIPPI